MADHYARAREAVNDESARVETRCRPCHESSMQAMWTMLWTVGMLLGLVAPALAGSAKGTVAYKGTTATVTHAFLVKGPDAIDPGKTIRRPILVAGDLEPKLAACKAMGCTDGQVMEGMTLDLDGGPRVNYWVALKGQLLQYSGTADPATLKTTTDEPARMAGTFVVDATGAGGPKIDVQFDAPLLKEFQAAR
jgi:hypothetical protein